jgi:hypothetical protein
MKTYNINLPLLWIEDDSRQENYINTTNSRVCRLLFYKHLGMCCSPHRGCNRMRSSLYGKNNWKLHRKNQYYDK